MSDEVVLHHLDAVGGHAATEELVQVYLDVYPDAGDGFHGENRFRQQLAGHLAAHRWEAVTARRDTAMVGYAYGFALGPDTRWWGGLLTEVEPGFNVEDGRRTFAISEILVRPEFRRRGIARRLHDDLLAHRRELRATLLVDPANRPAHLAYASWGWQPVAQLRPRWDRAPIFDVMILRLPHFGFHHGTPSK